MGAVAPEQRDALYEDDGSFRKDFITTVELEQYSRIEVNLSDASAETCIAFKQITSSSSLSGAVIC